MNLILFLEVIQMRCEHLREKLTGSLHDRERMNINDMYELNLIWLDRVAGALKYVEHKKH